MGSENRIDTSLAILRCPECDGDDINTINKTETFPYGQGEEGVTLTCTVPVRKCNTCGFAFTDDAASTLRHETVCRHLNVLTPSQIVSIRKHYGLSRSEFAKVTRIGEASLARWENGQLIQNAANDQLLFLLQSRDNLEKLLMRNPDSPLASLAQPAVHQKMFRALNPSERERRSLKAKTFSLRPVEPAA